MVINGKEHDASSYRYEYFAAVSATLSLVASVSTAGWSSPAIPALLSPDSHIKITASQGSWIVSILSIGGCAGSIVMSPMVERCGRKYTMIVSMVPLMIGWIMVVFASSVPTIYVARFLHGISYGATLSAAPIYLGEISSKNIRGTTGVLIAVMAKLAFLLQYSIGPYVSFRSLALINLSFPIVFLLTFCWMPESPYYYLTHGNEEAALESLRWLRRSDFYSESFLLEYHQMRLLVERNRLNHASFRDLFIKRNRKSLGIILLLSSSMQLTGINAILGYAQTIFSKLDMNFSAAELSITLGVVQLMAVSIPTFFVDKAGRRPMLLMSGVGSLIGLTICSLYFTLNAMGYVLDAFSWIPFVAVLGFIVSFAIGLATVPFAILGEVFPKNIKANANAVFSVITSLIVFTVLKMFQVISDGVGTYVAFWIFAASTAGNTVMIYLFVPETKGKSFDEIQEFMEHNPINDRKRMTTSC
ncbi:facilitated trehalose transporter Tret1 [Aedes aegypti]|uniref:Facilitated trehalose transporter Tret1 n=1 Tax=Aedes aegypti TaxID=7159 RepID=A0A6I8TLK2_AEDAE|nr:facilitated trehalose transporter Tret1 [Aedes aegypti]